MVELADVVGSTSQLLKAVTEGQAPEYIVATDNGILHKMRMSAPGKRFIEAPTAGNSATCKSCAHCPWMAMNALTNLAEVLETEPVLVVASFVEGDAQGIEPIPVAVEGIPNNHLSYAVQWFLIAATWAGMTLGLIWRIRQRKY